MLKNKKIKYVITCALGSGMIGFFASDLNEMYGVILFGLGVALMVNAIINLSK